MGAELERRSFEVEGDWSTPTRGPRRWPIAALVLVSLALLAAVPIAYGRGYEDASERSKRRESAALSSLERRVKTLESRRAARPVPTFEPEATPENVETFIYEAPTRDDVAAPCPRLADETVDEGIDAAYTDQMGRTASEDEREHWRARYREHESEHCENAATPETFTRSGIKDSDEARAWRMAEYWDAFRDSVQRTPCPTPRYSWQEPNC